MLRESGLYSGTGYDPVLFTSSVRLLIRYRGLWMAMNETYKIVAFEIGSTSRALLSGFP